MSREGLPQYRVDAALRAEEAAIREAIYRDLDGLPSPPEDLLGIKWRHVVGAVLMLPWTVLRGFWRARAR